MAKLNLRGLIAAPHTPFTLDEDIAVQVIPLQAEALRRCGVRGAFVCGTTGEGLSLTVPERKRCLEAWVDASRREFDIIAHVGAASERDAIELTKHAAQLEVTAVAALPCFYHRPPSIEAAVTSLKRIADAAMGLPTFYYHLPALSHVDFSLVHFAEHAVRSIPNFCGIKVSKPDLLEYAQLMAELGSCLDLPWGCDELYMAAAAAGAVVYVGSTYNHSAALYQRLQEAINEGQTDVAREISLSLQGMIRDLIPGGVIANQKRILSGLGIPLGDVRSPLARGVLGTTADHLLTSSLIDRRNDLRTTQDS